MKIIIFEYATGGGFIERSIPPDIISEGFSMLKTAIEDFQKRGHIVSTLIDSRLNKLTPYLNSDRILEISKKSNLKSDIEYLAKESDYSLIIAPETNSILSSLVNTVGKYTVSLNSKSSSVELVSNKFKLYNILNNHNLPTPKTQILPIDYTKKRINNRKIAITFPLIVKPAVGIGCENLNIIQNENQFNKKLDEILDLNPLRNFLIQDYIIGLPVSVSLLTNGLIAYPISLNLQKIKIETPGRSSRFLGGIVPIRHSMKKTAFMVAKKAVELFSGLRGYVGVDMILSQRGPIILEINPRLTLSYIGINKALKENLSECIIKICESSDPYNSIEFNKVILFQKVSYNFNINIEKFELVFPGLMLDIENPSYPLILVKCNNESEAMQLSSKLSNVW